MWDVVNGVLLAVTRPVVQEVVDVHFELLHLILLHVGNVVLQLLQRGQLHVRHHAPLFVKAPHDAGHQADHEERTMKSMSSAVQATDWKKFYQLLLLEVIVITSNYLTNYYI